MEDGDGGVAAHFLRDEVGQHARVRLERMHLVMCTRPMVVPVGQVMAVAVAATVSRKAWQSGEEHQRVPVGSATALTQRVAKE